MLADRTAETNTTATVLAKASDLFEAVLYAT